MTLWTFCHLYSTVEFVIIDNDYPPSKNPLDNFIGPGPNVSAFH